MTDSVFLVPLIVIFFPIFFILLWGGVSFIIANVGGWSRLAQFYETQSKFEGEKWHMKSGRMGLANYNGCLTIGANHEGIYLAVFPLFRFGHPPLFIPWYDVTASEEKAFFMPALSLTFARMPSVKLRVFGRLGDTLLSHRSDTPSY